MKNYGFKPDVLAPDHYVLGASRLPLEVLQPDGDWTGVAPDFEPQQKAFETYNCTGFNTDKIIEMLHLRKFGERVNYSDRYTGICAGTVEGGNSPHVVAESIRKNGLIPDSMLPFSDDLADLNEYYSFKGANESQSRAAGREWLADYAVGHEWVYPPTDGPTMPLAQRQQLMLEALKSSPLGVSVYAWPEPDAAGIYHLPPGAMPNHWTCTVVKALPGQYWLIRDTYIVDGSPYKKLAWDYEFAFVKRYTLTRNTTNTSPSWFMRLVRAIRAWFTIKH